MAEGALTALSVVLTQTIGWTLFAVCAAGLLAEGIVALRNRRKWGSLYRWDLHKWLGRRIDELETWRLELDREATNSTLNIDRIRKIEEWFWESFDRGMARRLMRSAPELADYWSKTSGGHRGALVTGTPAEVAQFSQFLGWSATRLRDIDGKLRD